MEWVQVDRAQTLNGPTCSTAKYTNIQIYKFTNIQIYKFTDLQIYNYKNENEKMERYECLMEWVEVDRAQTLNGATCPTTKYTNIQIQRLKSLQFYKYKITKLKI